jgi:hypothetical protein
MFEYKKTIYKNVDHVLLDSEYIVKNIQNTINKAIHTINGYIFDEEIGSFDTFRELTSKYKKRKYLYLKSKKLKYSYNHYQSMESATNNYRKLFTYLPLKQERILKVYQDNLSLNNLICVLLDLSNLDFQISKTGPFFNENPCIFKYFKVPFIYQKIIKQHRISKFMNDFGNQKVVNMEIFLDWAIDNNYIVKINHYKSIPTDIKTTLFEQLRHHNFISKDSRSNNIWKWQSSDKLLSYLGIKLEEIGILQANNKWAVLESYILRKNKTPLKDVAPKIKAKLPNKYKDIDYLIKSLP